MSVFIIVIGVVRNLPSQCKDREMTSSLPSSLIDPVQPLTGCALGVIGLSIYAAELPSLDLELSSSNLRTAPCSYQY